jgi:hypothetical protein
VHTFQNLGFTQVLIKFVLDLHSIWLAAATVVIFWLVSQGIAKSQAQAGVIAIGGGSRLLDFAINLPIFVAFFPKFPKPPLAVIKSACG